MSFINPLLILIVLTVGISLYAWSNRALMESWIMSPYEVQRRGQWYRFVTSGFLHANFSHLFFNLLAFYTFSPEVLNQYAGRYGMGTGVGLFLLLYVGGIVLSDVPTYLRHRFNPDYRSLGASGGVSAVVLASVLFRPVAENGGGIYIFPFRFPIQPFLFGLLFLGYSYFMGRRSGDNINHDAHFYGALYGALLTVGLMPGILPEFWGKVASYLVNLL